MRAGFGLLILSFLSVGVRGTVTGEKSCNKYICVTGLHDDKAKIDTYTLAPPDESPVPSNKFGWMAIGFGSMMMNTPMVIVWTNPDNTFTLSHRQASGYVMPTQVASPPRKASLQTASSFSNDSQTSITFTIPSNTTLSASALNQTSFIWAYSDTNPHSSWDQAKLTQHVAAGLIEIALLAPRGSATSTTTKAGAGPVVTGKGTATSGTTKSTTKSSTSSSSSSSSSSSKSSSRRTVLIAHVVCGALATMVLLPLGVLVPRYARGLTTDRWWLPVHGAVNGCLGGVLIVAAFGLARHNFHDHGGFNTSHRQAGLALFILTIFQIGLGMFTHWFKSPLYTLQTKSGRGPSNFIHMALGITIIVLGWMTVWKGLDSEWPVWSGTGPASKGYKAGWGILVAFFLIAYIVGLVFFLPRQKALEREQRRRHQGVTSPSASAAGLGKQRDVQQNEVETRITGGDYRPGTHIWSGRRNEARCAMRTEGAEPGSVVDEK